MLGNIAWHAVHSLGLHYTTAVGAIGLDYGVPIPGAQAFDKSTADANKVPADSYPTSIGSETL